MNILITGASGFVGKHLIKELLDNGHTPIAAVHSSDTSLDGVKTYSLDLTDANAVNDINYGEIDGVIHLAGLAAVGPSYDDPYKYISVNAGIEINLFEAALLQKSFPKFLVISSGSLYDQAAALPLNEESPVLPSSPYAVSKIAQEELAKYYSKRGFEVMIARPFNHIGPGQNLGFIVPDLTQQIIAVERGENNEVLVGNLEARRDYTDVRDICKAYRLLIESGVSGSTYNICSGRSLSGQELLDELINVSGTKVKVTQDLSRMRPADTPDIYGDYSRLKNDTGWSPVFTIEQTLKDVVEDWRNR